MPNIPRLLAEQRLAERQQRRREATARPTLRFVPEPIDQVPSPSELNAHSRVQVLRERPRPTPAEGLQQPPELPPDELYGDVDDEPTLERVCAATERTREEVPGPRAHEATRERVPRMFRAPPSPRDHEVTAKHDMSLLRMLIAG
jgi:hypothetical protein